MITWFKKYSSILRASIITALEYKANSIVGLFAIFTGLLIEPSLDYSTLLKRNRKVTSINACLATKKVPHVFEFLSYNALGGIQGKMISENNR